MTRSTYGYIPSMIWWCCLCDYPPTNTNPIQFNRVSSLDRGSFTMISTETRHFPPLEDAYPALAIRVTSLINSYMVWIGTTARQPQDIEKAPSEGFLCRDWACSMPPLSVCLLSSVVARVDAPLTPCNYS